MESILTVISGFLLFAMIIPANGFPVLLFTTEWRENAIGVSLMLIALSFAALIDASIVFTLLKVEGGVVALVFQVLIFLLINLGLWSVFLVIAKMKRDIKRAEKMKREVEENERSDTGESAHRTG